MPHVTLLDKARSLNRNTRYKNVYVTQDMTRKEQEIDYHLRKELKESIDKGGKTWSKEGETGYPRTASKRKASRTADIPITGAAKQHPIQHRVKSERNIIVNNKSVQCKYVLKCYLPIIELAMYVCMCVCMYHMC